MEGQHDQFDVIFSFSQRGFKPFKFKRQGIGLPSDSATGINPISGTVKGGNQGYSTFLPDNWTAQQKVDAMNEAYNNMSLEPGSRNIYEGTTKEGIKIQMIIRNNKVITAYPLF